MNQEHIWVILQLPHMFFKKDRTATVFSENIPLITAKPDYLFLNKYSTDTASIIWGDPCRHSMKYETF